MYLAYLLYVLSLPVLFVLGFVILILWCMFKPWAEDMADLALNLSARI